MTIAIMFQGAVPQRFLVSYCGCDVCELGGTLRAYFMMASCLASAALMLVTFAFALCAWQTSGGMLLAILFPHVCSSRPEATPVLVDEARLCPRAHREEGISYSAKTRPSEWR